MSGQPDLKAALQPSYQVVVIGGGPAGCACALALAQQGMSDILLLDAENITDETADGIADHRSDEAAEDGANGVAEGLANEVANAVSNRKATGQTARKINAQTNAGAGGKVHSAPATAADHPRFRIGESIPAESVRLFRALGLEQAFLQQGHAPCFGVCSYWGSALRGYNDSIMNPLGHGWHLARHRFDRFLRSQTQARGVQVLTGARLLQSTPAKPGFMLELELNFAKNSAHHNSDDSSNGNSNGSGHGKPPRKVRVHAQQVVDASGSRAVFARQRGSRKQHGLALLCLATRLPLAPASHASATAFRPGLTHLEAVPQGWWYGAYLPDAQLLLALYSDAASVKAGQWHRRESWLQLLASAPQSALLAQTALPQPTRVVSFPAPSYCLDQLGGPDWLAAGDAASSYDPVVSQGICKALENGLLAAQVLGGKISLAQYVDSLQSAYQQYLALRRHVYRLEQRWPEAAFWQRVHAAAK